MKLNNTYYIIRHGQATSNVNDWFAGWPENPKKSRLTKKGIFQIKKSSQYFKKHKIDLIYASDQHRTTQVAQIISKVTGTPIIFEKKLREIYGGIFNEKPNKYYLAYFKNINERLIKRPPKGESLIDCQKRMIDALKKIDKKYKNNKILIVSHGNPLWLLEGFVKNWNRTKLLKEYGNRIMPGEYRKLN
jgi:broad specificity phosphatase PhoE